MSEKEVLGIEIIIPANAQVIVNPPGYSSTHFCETVEVLIGIGKDNFATLIMSRDDHNALLQGKKIDINERK